MELNNKIIGLELIEIQKKRSLVELLLKDRKTNKTISITFRGLLFESPYPVLNRKVKILELNNTLGFKAVTQLRFLGLDPMPYNQLYIEMEGSTNVHKIELICVSMSFNLKTKRSLVKVH